MEPSSAGLVVRYSCPRCRADLEWTTGAWRGWVRCPACDRPALPPGPGMAIPKASRHAVEGTRSRPALRAEEWIASGDLPDPNWPPWSKRVAAPKPGGGPSHRGLAWFLGALALLLVAVGMPALAALVLLPILPAFFREMALNRAEERSRARGGGPGSGRLRPPGPFLG